MVFEKLNISPLSSDVFYCFIFKIFFFRMFRGQPDCIEIKVDGIMEPGTERFILIIFLKRKRNWIII